MNKDILRFERKYTPEPNTGCWLWTAGTCRFGYGRFHYVKRDIESHRMSWHFYRGPIPDGLCVLHKCDTPACVNPDHLFLGTRADNNIDCTNKKRQPRQNITHCKNGHLFSGYNVVVTSANKRACRLCSAARTRAHYAKHLRGKK